MLTAVLNTAQYSLQIVHIIYKFYIYILFIYTYTSNVCKLRLCHTIYLLLYAFTLSHVYKNL